MYTWQKDSNSVHYTRSDLICSVCGRKSLLVLSTKIEGNEKLACYRDRKCWWKLLETGWQEFDQEFLECRLISQIKNSHAKRKIERSKMTLKLRYKVLLRDGFQCVLCGDSGKNSKLEIDHKISISNGGESKEENLQTTCFRCNRGKYVD